MRKGRLEAFSDGVVLELKAPQGVDLRALESIVPEFLMYLVSFVFVGVSTCAGDMRWRRPIRFPSRRARAMPALVRSTSRTRSCSAHQLKMATMRLRVGPPVSSQGSRTLTTCTTTRSSSRTS
jgi:hypothetical protein